MTRYNCKCAPRKDFSPNLSTPLPHSTFPLIFTSIGGVELTTWDRKIKCINTVKQRIDLIFEKAKPEIRYMLFRTSLNKVEKCKTCDKMIGKRKFK